MTSIKQFVLYVFPSEPQTKEGSSGHDFLHWQMYFPFEVAQVEYGRLAHGFLAQRSATENFSKDYVPMIIYCSKINRYKMNPK